LGKSIQYSPSEEDGYACLIAYALLAALAEVDPLGSLEDGLGVEKPKPEGLI